MATYQLALTSISDLFPLSEIVTMQQTDGAAHKLKPRLFHKFTHLQVYSVDFHPSMNHAWHFDKLFSLVVYYETAYVTTTIIYILCFTGICLMLDMW